MIDSVALVWGGRTGTGARRADAPIRGRTREALAEPIVLDWDELRERLGDADGQVREIHYGDRKWQSAHWKLEDGIHFMYRPGRVEVRASLPKLVAGRNDVVLNERGVHRALRLLGDRVGDEIGRPLSLREAVPIRLDYCFQWEVPSVAAVQERLKQVYRPQRKVMNHRIAPRGGRTLDYGMGSKGGTVIRFYDKVGELADNGVTDSIVELDPDEFGPLLEHGEFNERGLDRLLRYEVQDRRRSGVLRLIHDRGYQAVDVRHELARPIEGLTETWTRDVDGLIEGAGGTKALSRVLAALYLAEHPEAWPVLTNRVHRNTIGRWKKRAQAAALALHGWQPIIPRTAFVAGAGSLWDEDDREAAAA